MRSGYTGGAVAAAVSLAGAVYVFKKEIIEIAELRLPKGETANIPVFLIESGEGFAVFGAYKDSGDDPDVTNGCLIKATVRNEKPGKISECFCEGNIFLAAGIGIGTVTKEGLEQAVGMPAINKVPREMIFEAVKAVSGDETVSIVLEIPEGERLAEKTFNERMGIKGGLSILGTTGILRPMSQRALVDSIAAFLKQRSVIDKKRLYMTPGNIGTGYLCENFEVAPEEVAECSNYLGEALDKVSELGFEELIFAGDAGKLCKTALGIFNTHSKVADCRAESFAFFAMRSGAAGECVEELMECVSTEAMTDVLMREDKLYIVGNNMAAAIHKKLLQRLKRKIRLKIYIFSIKYGVIGKCEE